MYPTECFNRLLAAYDWQDYAEMADQSKKLQTWLEEGGFPPRLTGDVRRDRVIAEALIDLASQLLGA